MKNQPQSEELEKALLGTLLFNSNAIVNIYEILKSECFYDYKHQLIYSTIISLFNKSNPIDSITVSNELKSMYKDYDYYETSSRKNIGITELFEDICKKLLNSIDKPPNKTIILNDITKKCNCC